MPWGRINSFNWLVQTIGVQHSMNASDTAYVTVSSPYTFHVSNECFPQSELTQPGFHPASWKRPPASEGSVGSELRDCQDSDSESLALERQYQLELQQRIRAHDELVGLSAGELEDDSLEEEDSLEKTSSEEQEGAKHDAVQCTDRVRKKESDGREQQPVDKYFSLKYNPNWKNTKEAVEFSEVEKHHVAEGGSVDLSQDSFYLHSSVSSGEKNQQEAKFQESFSEFGTELLSFHEPNAFVCSEPFRLHTRGDESSDGYYFKDSLSTYSSAFSLQIPEDRPQRAKKDFVEKNKRTLGLRTDKNKSYLQLHGKKQEVIQEQVADTKTVDEEPVQSALPYPNMKMHPEDKWYLNSQRLKDHQNKWSQRNKVKSNQNLEGRAFSRSDNHQPAGRPAKPKSWHYKHHQMSEFHTAPLQTVEQDNSNALQKCPNPSVGPDTNTAANSDTCLSNFPACTSKNNKNWQHDRPKGLPHGQQHLYNHATVPFFPRDGSTNGQAHPNQKKSSSTFNANYQEMAKDQVLLQDCKRQIYATSSLWPSQASVHSSPAAFCTAFQPTQTVERRHQEMSCLSEADDLQLFSPLPPLIPHIESDSEVDPERCEGNQVKISRSNSEGYLMQLEKQKQHKVCKKPYSSKACINLDVKLGGLGPDYEAIKEKKEKLKQQKEYAQRIKEHNMKNIALVQRLPPKPQVVSSVSRQKALEYAKKIPKPKTFTARQSEEEVKEERLLLPALKGDSLPPITSLETLQSRHEKEKQVVAAFRTLHIL
ncbi:jhy protein homolog isoform X1 [Phasianus colchicus]|uniref:jhy protein homolog isoform X1 n=1 Tax=Phasianus colchicus TaxID=9054 RepID=UPI00129DBBE1|nr:jhy protein homolog isoform X1 [Phasianus colchicus]